MIHTNVIPMELMWWGQNITVIKEIQMAHMYWAVRTVATNAILTGLMLLVVVMISCCLNKFRREINFLDWLLYAL